MIAEIGQFALILALCMAVIQGLLPIIGAYRLIGGWLPLPDLQPMRN